MREQILLKERKQKNLVNNNISRKKELKKMLFNFNITWDKVFIFIIFIF